MSDKTMAQVIRERAEKFSEEIEAALPADAIQMTVSIQMQATLALYEIAAQLATISERMEKSNA